MGNEIVNRLTERFQYLDGKVSVQHKNRIMTTGLKKEEFLELFSFVTDELGFLKPHVIVGVDDNDDLGVIYVFSNEDNILIGIKLSIPRNNPVIKSVSAKFPCLLYYERELVDLFGIQVEGLPDGPSYPLPDGWPKGSYPLRKEWNPSYFNKETMTYNPPEEKEEGQ